MQDSTGGGVLIQPIQSAIIAALRQAGLDAGSDEGIHWRRCLKRKNADGIVDYLSGLTITQGRHAGKPFTVLPWQRKVCARSFC